MANRSHTAPQHNGQSGSTALTSRRLRSGAVAFGLGAAVLSAGVGAAIAIGLDPAGEAKVPDRAAAVGAWDAGAYEWRPVAIGGGGFVTGYSVDLSGATRVARSDVYGAYLWDARQDRWVDLVTTASMPLADREPMRLNTGVYEVVVAPSDPRRIYLAMAGDLFRSEDGGARFVKTAMPHSEVDANSPFRHSGPHVAVHPDNPDLVIYGTPGDGLWRSDDGGTRWSRVASVPNPHGKAGAPPARAAPGIIVWFTPDGGQVWAMASGSRMLVSLDAGRSFSDPGVGRAAGPLRLRQGAFSANGAFYGVDEEGQKVWRFSGGQWSDLTQNPGIRPRRFGTVAINPVSGEVYVFDEGGRGYHSADAGAHWSRVTSRAVVGDNEPGWLKVVDKAYFPTGAVVFDPVVPNRLWNAAGSGVYFADVGDAGGTAVWTSQVRGIEELVANDVVAPPGQAPLFAAWDFGVHRREDLRRYSTGYGPRPRVLIAVQQVDWSAIDPSFLVTNASDTLKCCAQDGDSVLAGFSTDAGRTWSKFARLPQPPGTEASDPWRMSYGAIAVSANDVNNIVWVPANNRSPFFTRDRGASWTRVALTGEVLPFTGSYAHYYDNRRTVAADRVLPGVFYLYHSGDGANAALAGLWVTRDGAATWTRAWTGEIAPHSRGSAKLRAVPGQAGHLFFTTGLDGVGVDTGLRRSVDGGRNWTVLTGVSGVQDVAFGKAAPGAAYPALYIAGRLQGVYGVWRSVDDARSWTRIGQFPVGTLDQVVSMDADKDVFGRVYLGFKGSGWRYGQPSDCTPSPYLFRRTSECFGLAGK